MHTSFSVLLTGSFLFFSEGGWHSCGSAAAFWASSPVLKGQIKPHYIFEGGPHSGCHADAQMKHSAATQSQAATV